MYELRKLLCLSLICVCVFLTYFTCFNFFVSYSQHKQPKFVDNVKYILYWMPFWFHKDYFIGYGFEPFKNCKYKNCYATDHRVAMPIEEFDALLFHVIYEKREIEIPPIRKPHQYYICMNIEAPIYITPNLKPYASFFNWTMTYRFDSDIVRRHGFISESITNYMPPTHADLQKKTKLAAWFVSNCNTDSQREILTKEIQKYALIDIYGSCGNLTCSRKEGDPKLSSQKCYDMVERNYKFYFSFENSYCKDYSTEKLYNILVRNIVPIVYGAGDYRLSAPHNSVINVEEFRNVSELVNYLNYLDKNDEEYLKYFNWKKFFSIRTNSETVACQICQKLNEGKKSVYDDLYTWWWGENNTVCKKGENLPNIVRDLIK